MGFFIKIMARPTKQNADYFSHDCDMRNDIKIKALRRKYKHLGYSIYIITLELLGDSDYFQMKWDDDSIELLTPEYDCDTEELKEVINYCIQLNLLQLEYGYLHCENFTNRLEVSLMARRKDYCSNNSPISKLSGVIDNNNEVIDNINTQSKVKESIVDNSKVKESTLNKKRLFKVLNTPDEEIVDTVNEIDYTIDETEIVYTEQMKKNIIEKFADRIDNRFKLNSFLIEIDEDWGGWHNFLDICFGDDTSVKNNFNNKLNQYRNGIFK
jgi:hypothetical protein